MPSISLRWFFVLLGLFLISIGADLHLSRTATPAIDPASERIEVADFMLATRAGDLSSGQIVFRANATGLADLSARRGDRVVRTTARITDADLARHGTRRRLMLVGALALPVLFALTFAVPPTLGPAVGAIWVLLAFVLTATAFSLFQVPYIALPPSSPTATTSARGC